MVRFATPVVLLAGLALLGSGSAFAETVPRRAHKAARVEPAKPGAPTPAGNINAPSTDFSKVERPDQDGSGRDGGGMRPVLGAGGIGLGGGF